MVEADDENIIEDEHMKDEEEQIEASDEEEAAPAKGKQSKKSKTMKTMVWKVSQMVSLVRTPTLILKMRRSVFLKCLKRKVPQNKCLTLKKMMHKTCSNLDKTQVNQKDLGLNLNNRLRKQADHV